jgi:glycosyltransferase involved in cell wall biosynthesis
VLVPLYLKYWPATRYGEWLALSSLASYLSTLDVGLNTARVNRLRLAETYSQGSVLVLPSVEEGLARVQAQAMACGVPVIATPNTGSEDLCRALVRPGAAS